MREGEIFLGGLLSFENVLFVIKMVLKNQVITVDIRFLFFIHISHC